MSERLKKAFIDRYIPAATIIPEHVKNADEAIKTAVTHFPKNKLVYAVTSASLAIVLVWAIYATLSSGRNVNISPILRHSASDAFAKASRTAHDLSKNELFSSRIFGENTVSFEFTKEFDASKKTFSFRLSKNIPQVRIIVKDTMFASDAGTPLTLTTVGNGQFVVDRSIIEHATKALVNPYRIKEIRIILPADVSIAQTA